MSLPCRRATLHGGHAPQPTWRRRRGARPAELGSMPAITAACSACDSSSILKPSAWNRNRPCTADGCCASAPRPASPRRLRPADLLSDPAHRHHRRDRGRWRYRPRPRQLHHRPERRPRPAPSGAAPGRAGACHSALPPGLATASPPSPAVSLCPTCRYPSSANRHPASS